MALNAAICRHLPPFIGGVAVAGPSRARHLKGDGRYRGSAPITMIAIHALMPRIVPPSGPVRAECEAWAAPNRLRDNPWSDSGRPLMWRRHNIDSLRDMSRIKRYLISMGLVFFGLVFALGVFGAAWLSAY